MIIGVHGKARSGKDTLGNFIVNASDLTFVNIPFALALKNLCMESFDLSYDQLYGDLKEIPDKRFIYGSILPHCSGPGKSEIEDRFWTPREIMQAVGGFYRSIDYDYWVKRLAKEAEKAKKEGHSVIIPDVRHINECEYVKKNGVLVKIVRDEEQKVHGMDHESETALDDKTDEYFDIIVYNNGSLDDLKTAAEGVLKYAMAIQKYGSERSITHGR